MAKEVLKNNVSVNNKIVLLPHHNHTIGVLHLAVMSHHLNVARLLLDVGNADPNILDSNKRTPLHYLVRYPLTKIIPVFNSMINNKIDVNLQDYKGRTALHEAVIMKNNLAVYMLLSNSADPNIPDNEGRIPLHYAVMDSLHHQSSILILSPNEEEEEYDDDEDDEEEEYEDDEDTFSRLMIISMLLSAGSNINYQDNNREVPLHLALHDSNLTEARMLLQNKADPNIPDRFKSYPIHHAIYENPFDLDFFDFLLSETCVDVNVTNIDQATPLLLAIAHENAVAVESLLKKKADPDIPDSNGCTPMHVAVANGDLLNMILLVYSEVIAEIKGDFFFDLFHVEHGNRRLNIDDNIVKLIGKFSSIIRKRVNAMDKSYNTPLHYATLHTSLEDNLLTVILKLLLINGADVNLKNFYDMTPLEMANSEVSFKELNSIQNLNN